MNLAVAISLRALMYFKLVRKGVFYEEIFRVIFSIVFVCIGRVY